MFGVLFKAKKGIAHLKFMMVFLVDFIEITEMELLLMKHRWQVFYLLQEKP